jgi:hypothetical protein
MPTTRLVLIHIMIALERFITGSEAFMWRSDSLKRAEQKAQEEIVD